MSQNIRYLQPVASIKIIFAIILSLLAVYFILQGTLFGIILLGVALKIALRHGFELDLEQRKYRNLNSLFALDLGKWKDLPEIEYVSVFKTIKNSRARVITAEATMGFEVFKVNLFYNGNQHIEAYLSDSSDDAFKVAKHIAVFLELDILDATKPEQEWIHITSHQ